MSNIIRQILKRKKKLFRLKIECLQPGFTVIELLLVFAILASISTVAMVGFNQFNSNQQFNNAVLDAAAVVQKAKSRAQSQVKPQTIAACQTGSLQGYAVRMCGFAGAQCTGSGAGRYELHILCGSSSIMQEAKQLPTGISFQNGTSGVVLFRVLNGSAQSGSIILTGYGSTKTIQVSSVGNITVN